MYHKQLTKGERFDHFYMQMAQNVAAFSYCTRKKVGAVFVKDDVILIGYNGTISGFPNQCEGSDGETLPETLHAESNVFAKIMRAPISSVGGTMYCTLSPCINCAKQIVQAGISRFIYLKDHSDPSGLELMEKAGIFITKLESFSEKA
jgi:dCMP deaminase